MNDNYRKLPAVALPTTTVLPSMIMHFDIGEPKKARSIEKALQMGSVLFVVAMRDPVSSGAVTEKELFEYGTVCSIRNVAKLPGNAIRVMVEGKARARLIRLETDSCLMAVIEETVILPLIDEQEAQALTRALRDLFELYCTENKHVSMNQRVKVMNMTSLEEMVNAVSTSLPLDWVARQKLLDAADLKQRWEVLYEILVHDLELQRIRQGIQKRVEERINKNQKDYFLREQLKVIEEELGESLPVNEVDEFLDKLEKLKASDDVKAKIRREITHFKSLSGNSAEASVSRTYLETLLAYPWDEVSEDNEDISHASKVLEEDHYGLKDVKERILEYLAVRALTKNPDSPILCLVGPPGTGKTSIARSLARAMDRKYVRISLGGVKDEAEIRGHRRTYIGAMPGRIVKAVSSSGVSNPLMLLDEVDKLSNSYSGDPSSALLEVLDGEQNCRFSDHYMEIPVDLSKVLFIATANDSSTIPRPLLDRMEIIEISSYTSNEKMHIAKEHLVPRQISHHGLTSKQLRFTKGALEEMISGYTREAGVRQLERQIGRVCRKAARMVLEEHQESVRVHKGDLEKFLGNERFRPERLSGKNETGIANGLAWTSTGGVTLQIEVAALPGKGELVLTGQLGDVMKESARTGITYARSIAADYKVAPEYFSEHDLHIHIPEGAVPKDGPSAGITMATAIISAITGIPVRSDTCMTGEVTLRGHVLAIGGLKEKLLAAKKAGAARVLLPVANKPDVSLISEEITGGLDIIYVKNMDQVLENALAVNDNKDV